MKSIDSSPLITGSLNHRVQPAFLRVKANLTQPTEDYRKIFVRKALDGKHLKTPIETTVPLMTVDAYPKTVDYIVSSLRGAMPKLIPTALNNLSLVELCRYLYRYKTGGEHSLRLYVFYIDKFSKWIDKSPDEIIGRCVDENGYPDSKRLFECSILLEDYTVKLQDRGRAPKTIRNVAVSIKTWFQANGLALPYKHRLPSRRVNRDRAPTPEQVAKVIDIADLRGKVVVSMLALGGFRVGTLCQLQYGHVMENLEQGVLPVHIQVEAEITKGKYHGYDTFLGQEAVEYLQIYLDARKRGTLTPQWEPEDLSPESPLIRNAKSAKPKTVTPQRAYYVVQGLLRKTGLITVAKPRHKMCVHSFRKFFRTQLAALGVPRDLIEYRMGHTISTYHDITMHGVEWQRNLYRASGLSIRPKTKASRIDLLKELIRGWGLNPEEILTKKALSMPRRTIADPTEWQKQEVSSLRETLKEIFRSEMSDLRAK